MYIMDAFFIVITIVSMPLLQFLIEQFSFPWLEYQEGQALFSSSSKRKSY